MWNAFMAVGAGAEKSPVIAVTSAWGCTFGTVLLFSNLNGVFSFYIWLNKRVLSILSVHGVGAVRERGKTIL